MEDDNDNENDNENMNYHELVMNGRLIHKNEKKIILCQPNQTIIAEFIS